MVDFFSRHTRSQIPPRSTRKDGKFDRRSSRKTEILNKNIDLDPPFIQIRTLFGPKMMIANGEDIVRVSRLLGHASPKITLDVYAHMLPNNHYGSANKLSEMVFGPVVSTESLS